MLRCHIGISVLLAEAVEARSVRGDGEFAEIKAVIRSTGEGDCWVATNNNVDGPTKVAVCRGGWQYVATRRPTRVKGRARSAIPVPVPLRTEVVPNAAYAARLQPLNAGGTFTVIRRS